MDRVYFVDTKKGVIIIETQISCPGNINTGHGFSRWWHYRHAKAGFVTQTIYLRRLTSKNIAVDYVDKSQT